MGRLVIAHHKSYHPYRRDNIEKVRRDEEEARQKEAREEGRMMLADSEARIDLLRERAGGPRSGKTDKQIDSVAGGSQLTTTLPTTKGHINFFEDLEHNVIASAIRAPKKAETAETDKGFPLAPSAKDLKPWYSEGTSLSEQDQEVEDERRKRDVVRKSVHDPLTSITHQLASRASTSGSSNHNYRPSIRSQRLSSSAGSSEIDARLTRESSERQRALDLIRRKKRELEGSETPGTVHGGHGGYGDVFNRKEVEEAHRGRERKWDNWDRGRGDPRRRW